MKFSAMNFKTSLNPAPSGVGFSIKLNKTELREIEISYGKSRPISSDIIRKSADAEQIFRKEWRGMDVVESAYVLYLKINSQILGIQRIGQGGTKSAIVDPKVIFGTALKALADRIIIAHNHPSNSLKPSQADHKLTEKIKEAGKLLDIELLDHLILIPENGYYSFKDEGYI